MWLTLLMDDERRVRRVADACGRGISYGGLRKQIRDGTVPRVRDGAVIEGPLRQDARARHLDLIAGTVPVLSGDTWVLTHTSAVALLGLPMTFHGADTVWINRGPGTSGYRSPLLVSRSSDMAKDEIVRVGGYRVTSPGRTALDMARQFGFVTGTMIADAALAGGVTPAQMADLARRGAGRRGNAMAWTVTDFADGRSESPGESLMRAKLHRLECAPTDLQVTINNSHGDFVARCDYGWLEHGVVGEYDGPQKYLRDRKPGESLSDVIIREKAREADIRDQGLEVIRFCRADLREPVEAAKRLQRLLGQRGLLDDPWVSPPPRSPWEAEPW